MFDIGKKTNLVPYEVKNDPAFKPFFDSITIILGEMRAQDSRNTQKITLPKKRINMKAKSNYGITVEHWWDHNFGEEFGITIEWK